MSLARTSTEGADSAGLREHRVAQRGGMRIAGSLRDYERGAIAQAFLYFGAYDTFEQTHGIGDRGRTHTDGNAGLRMSWCEAGDEPVYVKIAGGK